MRKMLWCVAGLVCGAVVGLVAGLLLAPYTGSELQQRIRARMQELIERGREAAALKRAEMEAQLEAFRRGSPVVLQESTE